VGIRDSHTRDAQAGVQLKSKATVSERRVRVTLDDGQTAEHTVFWLVKTTPAGVLDPDDEDDDGTTYFSRT
jgi:hypothetical protein